MTNPLRDNHGRAGAQQYFLKPPTPGFAGLLSADTATPVSIPDDAYFVAYHIEGAFYVTYDGTTPTLPSSFASHSSHYPTDGEMLPAGTSRTLKIVARETNLDACITFYSNND